MKKLAESLVNFIHLPSLELNFSFESIASLAKVRYNGSKSKYLGVSAMEIGEVYRMTRPAFLVVGKAGTGPAMEADSWIPELWETCYEQLTDLQALAEQMGLAENELWGLMSDTKEWLAPWQTEGRYLAGMTFPVTLDRSLVKDFDCWELPAFEYLVVKTDSANLERMTEQMFEVILPQEQATLVATVQERYFSEFADDEVELCFPIRRVE